MGYLWAQYKGRYFWTLCHLSVTKKGALKCIAFKDDLTNFLRDKESYDSLSSLLDIYSECSGLQINEDKKRAFWVRGSYQNHKVLDINKVNESIEILGIIFTQDQLKMKELNFDLTLKAVNKKVFKLLAMEKHKYSFLRRKYVKYDTFRGCCLFISGKKQL